MPDMKEPYAYILEEIELTKIRARTAKDEIRRYRDIADVYNEQVISLEHALKNQIKADKENEKDKGEG